MDSQINTTEVFRIEGMHCTACSTAVERALNELPGVTAAVSLPAETATVTRDPLGVGLDTLREVVSGAGYSLHEAPKTRDLREEGAHGLLVTADVIHHLGVERSRRDTVHPDAEARELHRHVFGESDDGSLGGCPY